MEEVKELREVLEKVKGKLIAAGKIYGAMNFAFWLSVMSLYYVLEGIRNMMGVASALYWGAAIMIGIPLTIKIWNRLERLYIAFHPESKRAGKGTALLIAVSWIIGSVIGWIVIPSMTSIGVNTNARIGVGFLSFIGISILGEWLLQSRGREVEMIPAFLLPFLAIPIAWNMESGVMVWAGFIVAAGFGLTILLYLYSAFRAIER